MSLVAMEASKSPSLNWAAPRRRRASIFLGCLRRMVWQRWTTIGILSEERHRDARRRNRSREAVSLPEAVGGGVLVIAGSIKSTCDI